MNVLLSLKALIAQSESPCAGHATEIVARRHDHFARHVRQPRARDLLASFADARC